MNAKTKKKKGDGTVTVNFPKGAVLLVPRREDSAPGPVRLVFSKKKEALPVPPGTYRVMNYTIEKTYKGKYWALSGSGPNGRIIKVRRGKKTKVTIDARVRLNVSAARNTKGIMCCAGVQGDSGMGLTVIGGDARVPMTFKFFNGAGKTVKDGNMAYG